MSRWLNHATNELRLDLYRARRYLGETLLGFALMALLFGGLLLAVASISGKDLASGALDGLLIGFLLWNVATAAYSAASGDISKAMQARTLEPICVAPISLLALLLLRTLLGWVGSLLMLGLLIALLAWLTDGRMQMQHPDALLPLFLAVPALMGWGFASAGVLLLFKRAEAMPAVFALALMGLVALPAAPGNLWSFLPYALGAAAAKAVAGGGDAVSAETLGWIAVNSAVYLVLGLLLFAAAERRARRLGILGHT